MNVLNDLASAGRLSRLATPVQTKLGPLTTVLDPQPRLARAEVRRPAANATDKRARTLDAALDAADLRDGAVVSFHHHYRNGDSLVAHVMQRLRARGLRDLTLAVSSIFPVHAPLVPLMQDGTISHILTNYMKGPVADAVAGGTLAGRVLLQSHGGRARAITARQLEIDAAFVAAPLARPDGAATGRGGRQACGPLGYAAVDAAFARHTIVVADELCAGPMPHIDIPGEHVDAVVHLPGGAGNTAGILSGSTHPAETPKARAVAEITVSAMRAAGYLRDGLSLQSGAGGYSLGAVAPIGHAMAEAGVRGSFLSGGITGVHADLLASGLFERIRDVQCFDLAAVQSSIAHPQHTMMSAEAYASPLHPKPAVGDLDVMLLGAAEIDAAFNVNVVMGADGTVLGGPGGHPDAAAGAALRIVTTDLVGGGCPKLVPHVRCVSTPGQHVDLVVTPKGVAVHPDRDDLHRTLRRAGLPVRDFGDLAAEAGAAPGQSAPYPLTPRAYVEARDGGILDWI
ncbi:MAG: citrate lyase subunit alpha [Pseudomonadota bacterium]